MNKTSSNRFAGKTVVITGGAAGIGRTTSLAFASEGARVVILDIQEDAAQDTLAMINDIGGGRTFLSDGCVEIDGG